MLSQREAERGLVFSLLRRPGEDAEIALGRAASVPVAVEPEDIADPQLRRLLEVILENAQQDLATSTRLAAQATGVEEFDLIGGLSEVDPDALVAYAQAVVHHSTQREVADAAQDAVRTARQGDPASALDQIHERFASIQVASEEARIGTVEERNRDGETCLHMRQESMRSGEVRVAFPTPELNEWVPYLLPGQVVLITGATKTGKSSYVGQVFDYNVKRGMRGVCFHFEDTPEVMDLRRIARQMATLGSDSVSLSQLLGEVLSPAQREKVRQVRETIAGWGRLGTEVYCAGWTMEQVVRVWRKLYLRAKMAGDPLKFIVVDYLNKAELTPRKFQRYGLFGARGRDAELVKQTAEATGVVAFLVQQEGANGEPYETRQSKQKSQVWVSLQRARDEDTLALKPGGKVVVKNANMGRTGAVEAFFYHRWMLWG